MVYFTIQEGTLWPIVKANACNPESELNGLVRAMIDTGASRSLMKKYVFDSLKLELLPGAAQAHGAGSKEKMKYYGFADLGINVQDVMGSNILSYTFLVEGEIIGEDNREWDVILGTDFLEHCNFEYRGREKRFGLEFLTLGEKTAPH